MTTPAARALARNDRYLREFVEGLGMCPFARRCRETGKLQRRVLFAGDDPHLAVRELEALPVADVEVALLIFPDAPAAGEADARAFEGFAGALRERMGQAHAGAPPFYCVAFHPWLPRDLGDEHRAVRFIRRSPDPVIQLVRAAVLQEVRAGRESGDRYVDAAKLSLTELLALAAPPSLSDGIAQANLSTLRREGADRVEALLASLRAP